MSHVLVLHGARFGSVRLISQSTTPASRMAKSQCNLVWYEEVLSVCSVQASFDSGESENLEQKVPTFEKVEKSKQWPCPLSSRSWLLSPLGHHGTLVVSFTVVVLLQ
jgi:hypothetical protein